MKLGMHVDNWRHFGASFQVPCPFAGHHGLEHVEFGTIDGDYSSQAPGFSPPLPPYADPLVFKSHLDSLGLKMSQLEAAHPMSCPSGPKRPPVRSSRVSSGCGKKSHVDRNDRLIWRR